MSFLSQSLSTLECLWNIVLSPNLVLVLCIGSRDGTDLYAPRDLECMWLGSGMVGDPMFTGGLLSLSYI